MGLAGWFHWMSEEVDKYKLLRDMTKDENKKEAYDEIIKDLENKLTEQED